MLTNCIPNPNIRLIAESDELIMKWGCDKSLLYSLKMCEIMKDINCERFYHWVSVFINVAKVKVYG